MFRPFAYATLTALSAAASAAPAAPTPAAPADHFQHMLQKMDRNGDGRISLDEYLAEAGAHFKTIDSANKGHVDAADIASSPAALERIDRRAERLVARLDSAGAGYVTADEFAAAAQKRYARLDRNGDGRLTPDELVGHGRHHATAAAQPSAAPAGSGRFERADANHDGVVTLGEYTAAARALYAELDAQHNGKVSAAEIAGSANAQQRAIRVAGRIVRHLDSDGYGSVSQDEFLAAARTRFARLDKNGDGFIDAAEATGVRHAGKGHQTPG